MHLRRSRYSLVTGFPLLSPERCAKPCEAWLEAFAGAGPSEGDSCRADELFDPMVPLFTKVFKHRPDVFPAQEYASPEWLEVHTCNAVSSSCWLHICCTDTTLAGSRSFD